MPTIKELARKTMTPEKRASAKHDYFAYYIGRPISYVLTLPFLALGIKPNTVSLLSFIPSIMGFFFLGFGYTKFLRIIGVLWFFLWNFMDGVDGNVARYTQQTSTLGILWDATSGYLAMILTYFSVGISVMNSPKGIHGLWELPNYYYVVMAGLTSLLTLFSRLVMHKRMILFAEEQNDLNNTEHYSALGIAALNLTSPSGFMQIILLMAVALNAQREFVSIYFLIHFAITVYSLKDMLRDPEL